MPWVHRLRQLRGQRKERGKRKEKKAFYWSQRASRLPLLCYSPYVRSRSRFKRCSARRSLLLPVLHRYKRHSKILKADTVVARGKIPCAVEGTPGRLSLPGEKTRSDRRILIRYRWAALVIFVIFNLERFLLSTRAGTGLINQFPSRLFFSRVLLVLSLFNCFKARRCNSVRMGNNSVFAVTGETFAA